MRQQVQPPVQQDQGLCETIYFGKTEPEQQPQLPVFNSYFSKFKHDYRDFEADP